MSLYQIDFSNIWSQLTPPVLRKTVQNEWGNVLTAPVQYMRDLVFDDYVNGSPYAAYSGVSAYTAGDRVVYSDRGVYESISGSTGTNPLITSAWTKVNDNYIGVNERVKYNAQKMTFEYGLNRNFQCTGIYIANSATTTAGMLLGNTGAYSSYLSNSSVPISSSYLTNGFSGINTICYTIWVPNTVFTGLSTTYSERVNIVRNFADLYNIAGMQYSVSGY